MITAKEAWERQLKLISIAETLETIGEAIEKEIDSGSKYTEITYHLGSEEKVTASSSLPVLSAAQFAIMKQLQSKGYSVEHRWCCRPYVPAAYQDTFNAVNYDHHEFVIGWGM